MSTWRCTICGKSIEGSLDVVLALAREHQHMGQPCLGTASSDELWWGYWDRTIVSPYALQTPSGQTNIEAQTEVPCERCCP